jgi:hypothetical protein
MYYCTYLGRDKENFLFRPQTCDEVIYAPEERTLFSGQWVPKPGEVVNLEKRETRIAGRGRPKKWYVISPV